MPLGSTFHPEVVTVSRKATVIEIARLMREKHIGAVVVVDERMDGRKSACGIITDRDLVVEVLAEEIPVRAICAEDIMTRELFVAKRDSSTSEMIALMLKHGVRRLPVIDESESLVGIFSADDFLDTLGKEIAGLSKLSRKQVRIESRLRA